VGTETVHDCISSLSSLLWPGLQIHSQASMSLCQIQRDDGVDGRLDPHMRRDLIVLEDQQHLEQRGNACSGFTVSYVRFHCPEM